MTEQMPIDRIDGRLTYLDLSGATASRAVSAGLGAVRTNVVPGVRGVAAAAA